MSNNEFSALDSQNKALEQMSAKLAHDLELMIAQQSARTAEFNQNVIDAEHALNGIEVVRPAPQVFTPPPAPEPVSFEPQLQSGVEVQPFEPRVPPPAEFVAEQTPVHAPTLPPKPKKRKKAQQFDSPAPQASPAVPRKKLQPPAEEQGMSGWAIGAIIFGIFLLMRACS